MIRGTAQQFKIILPHSLSGLDWITIQFWQQNNPNTPITKTKIDCTEYDGAIYFQLNASETKKFSDKYKVKMQMRAQPMYGVPFGSILQLLTVYPMSDSILDSDTENSTPAPSPNGLIILDGGSIIGE